jgi:hypothetical protein
VLSETQIRLLGPHSVEFRCRHVEAFRPGELLNQDTFYWGTLKGVGKVYVQVVVDVFCLLAFGACQGSCRLGYAAEADSFSLATASLTTDSRSGLSVTAAIGCQLRVCRVQRRGLAARACRYRSCRRARMS